MTGITALILFAAWTLILMTMYIGYRVAMMLTGKPADTWTRGRDVEVPDFVTRAQHAHMNAVENLPVYGAVVLGAYALGKADVADSVATYFLLARIAQSTVHLIGVNHVLVIVRATFYTIQVLLIFSMIARLL